MRRVGFLFVFLLMAMPALAQSGTQKLLGTFGVWKAYSYKDGDQNVCYMVKTAAFPKGKFKRGPAYLMITQRPGENSRDVISYTSGYNFKPASDVRVKIGGASYDLFTQKDTAWSRDSKTDRALTASIRNNTSLKLTAIPADQRVHGSITDTLDLKGAEAAYRAAGRACGMDLPAPPKTALTHKKRK